MARHSRVPEYESESERIVRELQEQKQRLEEFERQQRTDALNAEQAERLRKEIKKMGGVPVC